MQQIPEEDMAFNKKKKGEEAAAETPVKDEENLQEEESAAEEQAAPEETPCNENDAQLKAAQALAEEYLNMAQRVQADFDNFRRRNQNVRAEAFEDGAREFIKTLLPVVDNLERALQTPSEDAAFKQGVEMVYKQLNDTLSKRGVTVIDRQGEKFDPNLENAVMQGTSEEGEPGTVCLVLQKGYKLGETVLRHAMVKVVAEA